MGYRGEARDIGQVPSTAIEPSVHFYVFNHHPDRSTVQDAKKYGREKIMDSLPDPGHVNKRSIQAALKRADIDTDIAVAAHIRAHRDSETAAHKAAFFNLDPSSPYVIRIAARLHQTPEEYVADALKRAQNHAAETKRRVHASNTHLGQIYPRLAEEHQ